MPPKTTGWDELHLAENPAVELLESLGYTYVPPETLESGRASPKETILTAVKAVTQIPAASPPG